MNPPSVHKVQRINRYLFNAVLLGASLVATNVAAGDVNEFVQIDGNSAFQSALLNGAAESVQVTAYWIQQHPVTNEEYLNFVTAHPEWRRGSVASIFANSDYLAHWQSPLELGAQAPMQQPVTRISWFAAQAYCESIRARLPTWYEWELAAAANEQLQDARKDAAWSQRILDWYAKPGNEVLGDVMQDHANYYGVYDLHGLIWEWVLDFNSIMDSTQAKNLCGGSALNFQQKENFAILMRVALLSSLHGSDTLRTLGFRCAKDAASQTP